MVGVHRATVGKWLLRVPTDHRLPYGTQSARPHHHPNEVPRATVNRVVELRSELGRCAPVLHAHLIQEGYKVSQRSVGRILKREKLVRKKKQATLYKSVYKRPVATSPGALVQMDTIHIQKGDGSRFYIYTLIDLYSRLAYAEYHPQLRQKISFKVIAQAQSYFGFSFSMLQTDHGPEFSQGLTFLLSRRQIKLRHSRIRTPNDNAHIERFNRTIQEECFGNVMPNEKTIEQDLRRYIKYYNYARLHLGLNLLTPGQFVAKVLS
jgi:transposase InsO family protein